MCGKISWFISIMLACYGQLYSQAPEVMETFQVHLVHNADICVGERVMLTCPDTILDKNVLSYQWVMYSGLDSSIISDERFVIVSPTVKTSYGLHIQFLDMTKNLVKHGDFEDIYDKCENPYGVPASRIFSTLYWSAAEDCGDEALFREGGYKVGRNPKSCHRYFFPRTDHTSGSGQMLIVNGNYTPNAKVWQQKIENIEPGVEYAFSAWGMRVSENDAWGSETGTAAFQFSISEDDVNLGILGGLWTVFNPKTSWTQMFEKWKNASGWRDAYITLVDQTTVRSGNDFAVDDIVFAPIKRLNGRITLNVKPRFRVEDMVDRNVCEGVNVEVKPVFYGEATTFAWYRNSTLLPDMTTKDLILNNVTGADAGMYRCVMSGGSCGGGQGLFNLTVNDSIRLGSMADQVVEIGAPAKFKVDVLTGKSKTTKYQWSLPAAAKGWVYNLTSPEAYKAAVDRTDVGVYTCKVIGTCGEVSVKARLDIAEKVVATVPPPVVYCPDDPFVQLVGSRTPANTSKGYWIHMFNKIEEDTLILKPEGGSKDISGYYEYWYEMNSSGQSFLGGFVTVDRRDTLQKLTLTGGGIFCENENVILKANAQVGGGTGYTLNLPKPKLIYTWTKPGGSPVVGDSVLSVRLLTPDKVGLYQVTVVDECGTQLNATVELSIKENFGSPKISGDLKVCLGERGQLEVLDGADDLSYLWTTPGGRTSTASSITLPRILAQDTGWYTCRLTSACGQTMDLRAHVGLYPGVTATEPTDPFVKCEGERVEFTVTVGEGETYVWYRAGGVVGNPNVPYVIDPISISDAGTYECLVTTHCGETKRLKYTLLVHQTTRITEKSPDQFVIPGVDVTLFVKTEGSDLIHAWTKTGAGNVGVNSPNLPFTSVVLSDAGEYICKVTGRCGSDNTKILLNVGDYNELTKDRAENWCLGGTYSYTAALRPTGCTESASLLYSWRNPKGVEVSKTKALVITNVTSDMAGEYVCTISGTCGTATLRLKASVLAVPRLSLALGREKFCEGENLEIKATVNDSIGGYTFEWRHDGAVLGTTVANHKIVDAELTDAGRYTCTVLSFCGKAASEVNLVVGQGLRVLKGPESLNLCKGNRALLEVKATGDSLTYSWAGPAGAEWSGNNTASYLNGGVSHDAAGKYHCVLNSRCGIDTLYAWVNVEEDLVLVNRTPNVAACKGEKIVLWAKVNLDGSRYTWTLPNGTHSSFEEITINSITPGNKGNYVYHIESAAGCSSLTDSIPVWIYAEPGALTLSPDTAVCAGGNARMAAAMSGVDVSYSWMGPGRFVADTAVINISGVDASRTGYYQVIAKDICKVERQGKVNLTLLNEFEHISISRDTAICRGENVSFRVNGGVPGMIYSWFHNGTEIAKGAVLTLNNVQPGDVGKYVCLVKGTCESVEKSVALSLLKPLEFSAVTDLMKSVCDGETVVFGVAASGENVTYQWQKNSVDVGTMDSLLTLTNVTARDGGDYICRIKSACATEEIIFGLRVKESTQIIGRTPDKHVSMNDSVNLKVIAKGENNVYEWTLEGVVKGDAPELPIPNVGNEIRDFLYKVKVTGDCGVDSLSILVKVGDFINVPILGGENDTICEGSNYSYVASLVPYGCYGGEPVNYKWIKSKPGGDLTIQDGSSDLFKIREATPIDTGSYRCEIIFKGCPIDSFDETKTRDTSFDLRIAMIGVPVITSIVPADTSVVEGFDHEIRVVATGDALKYSWKHDGVNLPGKNGDIIGFDPVFLDDAGLYRVTVENVCSRMEATSRLRVYQKTVITSPNEQWLDVCLNSDITLETEAIGTNLVYRWYTGGRLIAASSSNTYTVKNIMADVDYQCIVSGSGGKDTCMYYLKTLDLPEVSIEGKTAICMSPENYKQEYKLVSPQTGLQTVWSCTGGTSTPIPGGSKTEVLWSGIGTPLLEVTATSLATGCSNRAQKEIRYVALPDIWLDLPAKVGYCIDSLLLNKVWPLGGYFIWKGDTVTSLVFNEKNKEYQPVYYYTDPQTRCVGMEEGNVGIDVEPLIRLAKSDDTTGICRPITLSVESHTSGKIVWGGSGSNLDTTDLLNAVYTPSSDDSRNIFFEAKLTDPYGCKALDDERILVVESPRVLAMNDTIVGSCEEEEQIDLILKAQYTTAYFNHLNWLPKEKTNVKADYTAEILKLDPNKNIFIAEIYDVFGCHGRDSVMVTLVMPPVLANEEICFGDTLFVHPESYKDFRWSDDYMQPQRLLTAIGRDTLWVTNEYGCEGMAVYTVRPLPATNLIDTFLLRGQTLDLHLNLNPDYAPYDIYWQDGSASSVYTVRVDGDYWVRVLDNIGCMMEDSARITLIDGIYAPNAFLPESNGENARFYLKELNFIGNFEMLIYNRWGELIYKTREIGFNGGWDGTFQGKKCDVGTYVWVAFNNGKRLGRGSVTLIK